MHAALSNLEIKLATLHSFTFQQYKVKMQTGTIDDQLKKLQTITTTVLDDAEKQIVPTVMQFLKLIVDSIDNIGIIVNENCEVLYANILALKTTEEAAEKGVKFNLKNCLKDLGGNICSQCHAQEALKKKQVISYKFTAPSGNCYDVVAIPMRVNSLTLLMITAFRRV